MKNIFTILVVTVLVLFSHAQADWNENFDDGDISDWTIINPIPGYSPITIETSSEQSVSPIYSLKVTSPNANGYVGSATGPDVQINPLIPYNIEFQFRWNNFHWVNFAKFQNVLLVIDYPSLRIKYYDDAGGHFMEGTPAFRQYCPSNTWTHFKIEVDPNSTSYTLFANENQIGTVNYGTYNTFYSGFGFYDSDGWTSSPNYFNNSYYDDISIYQACGIEGKEGLLPTVFSLDQNYPNPFNARTVINFGLPEPSEVELAVYNILGQKVITLVSGKMEAGYHQVNWNAGDQASGMYFYRINAGDYTEKKKMMLLK